MPPEEPPSPLHYAKAITDALKEPLLVVDESMKVLLANAAFYAMFPASEKETVGQTLYSLGSGQWSGGTLKKHLEAIVSHATSFNDCEVQYDLPTGAARTMAVSVTHLSGIEPHAMLVVIEDITARGDIQHDLLISEVRYRKLFETAKDGILLINPETEKIIDANPFLLDLIKYSKAEILGKELWEIGAVKDIAYAKMMFEELQTKGYARYEDIPIKSKDGREREVEFVSNRYPIDGTDMIQCNIRDITDRKAAERKATTYLEGLEKLNKMMTGREIKMAELKDEIDALKKKIASNA